MNVESTRLVKCLPHKDKDQSSSLQKLNQKLDMEYTLLVPESGRLETGGSLGLAGQPC